jgi:PAS domain-containing protein
MQSIPGANPLQSYRSAVVGAALFLAIIYAVAGFAIYDSRNRTIADSESELQKVALAMAGSTSRIITGAKNWQRRLVARIGELAPTSAAEFARIMGDQRARLVLENGIAGLPQVSAAALVDGRGKTFTFTPLWPILSNDLRSYSVFNTLQSDAWIGSVLGGVEYNRVRNFRFVLMAQRVSAPNGDFIGIAALSVRLGYFSQVYQGAVQKSGGSVGLYRNDGVMLSRYPEAEAPIGSVVTHNALFEKLLASRKQGVGRTVDAFDGKERIVALHSIPEYELVIAASVPIGAVLAEWWRNTVSIAVILGLITCLVGIGLFILRGGVRRTAPAENEVGAIDHTRMKRLDTALDTISQGLSLFDTEQRLVIANRRYAEIYNFSPEQIAPGVTMADIVEHHIDGGTYAGDNADAYRRRALAAARERIAATAPDAGPPDEADSERIWGRVLNKLQDGRTIAIVNRPMPGGGWVGTHEDISEYQHLEEERERSLELISMIVENIPLTVVVKDAESLRYLLVNHAAEVLFQTPRDQVIGQDAHGLFPKDQAEVVIEEDRKFLASGKKKHVVERPRVLRGKDRVHRITRVRIGRDQDKAAYILSIVEDFAAGEKTTEQRMSA